MTGFLSSSTSPRRDTFDSPDITPLPDSEKTEIGVGIPLGVIGCLLVLLSFWCLTRCFHTPRRPHNNDIPMVPMGNRREGSDSSGSGGQHTERGLASTDVEGSQFGTEFEGSPVVLVGPLDTGASETPVGPINPTASDIAAPDVASDNGPHRTEVEGSQVGADVEGTPVDSIEMDASETPNGPTNPPPPYVAAPDVAPDNNP